VLARSGLTLVIYMGVANAGRIQEKLLAAGLSGATPVAAVARATLAEQRIATGTLSEMAEMIAGERIASPAILIIGEVARAAVVQLAEQAREAAA
jgi:uroporphyrin-III C-methyltransferase